MCPAVARGGGHEGQELCDGRCEPLVERLFGIGFVGGQADGRDDAFEREVGFRTQRGQGGRQVGDGDFARFTFEEAGFPGQGFGGQAIEAGPDILEAGAEPHVRSRG